MDYDDNNDYDLYDSKDPMAESSCAASAAADDDSHDDDPHIAGCETKYDEVMFLQEEIAHLMEHGIQPPIEWYESRIHSVHRFAETDWQTLGESFAGCDDSVYESCQKIQNDLEEIMEEWSISPIFSLSTYYHMMHVMAEFLPYYRECYVDEHLDIDVSELMKSFHTL
jgi:hypothetical protein